MDETHNCFYINIIGQIESCYFPMGLNGSKLFCRYDIQTGTDWELVSGQSSGVTQCSSASSGNRQNIIFNMPIEIMYKSINPHGWPQICFSFYGNNWWGSESSKGYARVHVPLAGQKIQLKAPIISVKCLHIWSSLLSWFSDRNPELKDPKVLLEGGNKTKGLQTESYGVVIVSLQSITRGTGKLSLNCG